MTIRPKKIIKAATGVKFTPANANGANWRQQVFNNYRQHLLDQLAAYGKQDDYGYWLNEMQSRHAKLYNSAGKDFENIAYENSEVGKYQHDYKGDQRFGTIQLNPNYKNDFNQSGIKSAQTSGRYDTSGPTRVSGDYSRSGFDYKVDNLYSAITDDRRLLGRLGDWDTNSQEYKDWQTQLKNTGWEMFLDNSDNYYKLRRLPESPVNTPAPDPSKAGYKVQTLYDPTDEVVKKSGKLTISPIADTQTTKNKNPWLQQLLPGILSTGRLIGNIRNNNYVFDQYKKAIRPILQHGFSTHSQVVGDEATKQAYYNRAAQGQTKAARPFTSDADRQMAYQMEAKRIGDQLRTEGDLADNKEIRRTSEKAMEHEWANTERDNKVANTNIAAIGNARAKLHELEAQRHSANWTSADNWLKGIEYNIKQDNEKRQAYNDQLLQYQQAYDLANDPTLRTLNQEYDTLYDEYSKDPNNQEKKKAYENKALELRNAKLKLQQQQFQQMWNNRYKGYFNWFKNGGKINRDAELLYKVSRDAVKHFREMSKISANSNDKNREKPIKLNGFPKKSKKMQSGGAAPFTVYSPLAISGGEGSISQKERSTSKSKDKEETPLDVIKELFKGVNGLPSDVNQVYSSMQNFLRKSRLVGDEVSSDDLATMYLSQLQKINEIKYSKEAFDKARENANSKDALHEFAVSTDGRIVVQQESDGTPKLVSVSEFKNNREKYNPLTNEDILNLRATGLPFNNEILQIVNNGVGMTKIAEFIRQNVSTLGTTDITQEGYVKKEADQIKQGIASLMQESQSLANAPAGEYKETLRQKLQEPQVQKALQYIMDILPSNMKSVLSLHTNNPGETIANMLMSKISSVSEYKIDAVTGKSAKDANGKSTEGDIKSNFLVQVQKDQIGVPRKFSMITRDGNSELYSLNSKYISQLPNVTEDMSIDKMLGESKIGTILDSGLGITFGDQVIPPENLKDVMFDKSGGATIVTLPCRWENGHKVVNFEIKDKFDEAVKEAGAIVPIDYQDPKFNQILSQKLKEKNLNSLLIGDQLDPDMFGHFMVVSAYTTDRIKLNNFGSKYIEKVNNPDKALEDRLSKGLSTNKDKNDYKIDIDDKWGWFEGTWDDVYRGSVFIPLNNDPVSAQTGWGNDNIKLDEVQELAAQHQTWNKMSKAKSTDSSQLQ